MPNRSKSKKNGDKNLLLGCVALLMLVVLVFFAKGNFKIADRRKNLADELKSQQQKVEELSLEREGLENKIFQSDEYEYLEEVAREELNLRKAGESVVAFPVVESASSTEIQDEEQQNLWQKIMDKIR